MKTLRQVGVGQTVTVKRLHGEGPVKTYHGYGNHQRGTDLCT